MHKVGREWCGGGVIHDDERQSRGMEVRLEVRLKEIQTE